MKTLKSLFKFLCRPFRGFEGSSNEGSGGFLEQSEPLDFLEKNAGSRRTPLKGCCRAPLGSRREIGDP